VPLNPWRLRLLVKLAELTTVRAVALDVGMSASSVSNQLAVLETETGAQLLERIGRRVALTAQGQALVERARGILFEMDVAEQELKNFTSEPAGRVTIAAFSSSIDALLLPLARDLGGRYPLIDLHIVELDPNASLPYLRRGDCDIAITAGGGHGAEPVDDSVLHVPLLADPIVLVRAGGGQSQSMGVATLADFAAHPWSLDLPGTYLGELVTRLCREAGFEPRIAAQFFTNGSLLAHVEAGLSVTLLPELAVDPRFRVTALPLAVPAFRSVTAAVRRGGSRRTAVDIVMTALREQAARYSSRGVSLPAAPELNASAKLNASANEAG
jgi:DNA-binding transcriptional LysR family regulator